MRVKEHEGLMKITLPLLVKGMDERGEGVNAGNSKRTENIARKFKPLSYII